MARFFNTTGPCDPRDHYTLPAERRMPDLLPFIERKQYFVVHAPRQVGKTTAMMAFAARLRERGSVAVWATLESSQGVEDPAAAEPLWIASLARFAGHAGVPCPAPSVVAEVPPGDQLGAYVTAWAASLDAPLVLLLDEADVVRGPALISLLRQLRAGFMQRGVGRFPTSVGLIGMRDLRDYVTEAKGGAPVNPGSPFNIKAGSFTIRSFNEAEVAELLAQHTAETGQPFTPAALAELFRLTQGQPFLVNWLADHCVTYGVTDRSVPVDVSDVAEARERLILSRTTHLDSLGQRLKDPRVAPIVEAALLGDDPGRIPYDSDDFQYVVDLGLLVRGPAGVQAANPLYAEVLARQLSLRMQEALNAPRWRWATAEGRLDFPALMREFLSWWRENADILPRQAPGYPEAVPHLSLMAFLQRVVNGGGRVEREFAAGRGALDLLVSYGPDRFAVEVKRVRERDGLERVREAGIAQTLRYLDTVGLSEGWLVLFDVRDGRSWEERLWAETVERDGRVVHLRGA